MPADFADVSAPLSLALGGRDSLLGEEEVGRIREVMQEKRMGREGEQCESEVRVYEDQVHGFALRGDWTSEKDRKAMDEATRQGLEWFGRYLS